MLSTTIQPIFYRLYTKEKQLGGADVKKHQPIPTLNSSKTRQTDIKNGKKVARTCQVLYFSCRLNAMYLLYRRIATQKGRKIKSNTNLQTRITCLGYKNDGILIPVTDSLLLKTCTVKNPLVVCPNCPNLAVDCPDTRCCVCLNTCC